MSNRTLTDAFLQSRSWGKALLNGSHSRCVTPGSHWREIEQDLFVLVSRHPDATAMARVRIERQSVDRFFFWPMPGGAMDVSAVHLRIHLPIST